MVWEETLCSSEYSRIECRLRIPTPILVLPIVPVRVPSQPEARVGSEEFLRRCLSTVYCYPLVKAIVLEAILASDEVEY